MENRYANWTRANVEGDGYGQCAEITARMAADFPELTRVRGHYYCHTWGERAHWWLVTLDSTIVDPTAQQFPSKGLGIYEPWAEGAQEPTGLCMNCGAYCYDGDPTCSEACERANTAYYTTGVL